MDVELGEASELVDETETELGVEVLVVLTVLIKVLELELPPLDAAMLKGKEYWKMVEFESRLIFKPYVASSPRSLSTAQE